MSGDGQFGINPVGGEWGFYVGERPLRRIIADAEPDMSRLENALSAPGYEYEALRFEVVPKMHINTNPGN